MYYHASETGGIQYLKPQISNHRIPLVYFSLKRENALIYLSNAVEKYCRSTGYVHNGPWHKWASYGFTENGILRLEEYYPNAVEDTYKGVAGYIYSTDIVPDIRKIEEIPYAAVTEQIVRVQNCEYIPDAYVAIMEAVNNGKIVLQKYEDMNERQLQWIRTVIEKEYQENTQHEEYRYFLKAKFMFLHMEGGKE